MLSSSSYADGGGAFPARLGRLRGPSQWLSAAVPFAPVALGFQTGGGVPDSRMSASSEYYIRENAATWVTKSTTVGDFAEIEAWIDTAGSGLDNEYVCVMLDGVPSCAYRVVDSGDITTGDLTFPMYLALDQDHGHPGVDPDELIASFMRWKYPADVYTGWRRGAAAAGDMRARALFIQSDELRSENQLTLLGYETIQTSPDLGAVRSHPELKLKISA